MRDREAGGGGGGGKGAICEVSGGIPFSQMGYLRRGIGETGKRKKKLVDREGGRVRNRYRTGGGGGENGGGGQTKERQGCEEVGGELQVRDHVVFRSPRWVTSGGG
jgi:hypothetical protein